MEGSLYQLIAETALVSFVSAACLLCVTVVRALNKPFGVTMYNCEDADGVALFLLTFRTIIHERPTTNCQIDMITPSDACALSCTILLLSFDLQISSLLSL